MYEESLKFVLVKKGTIKTAKETIMQSPNKTENKVKSDYCCIDGELMIPTHL